jgi:hypothetical protein
MAVNYFGHFTLQAVLYSLIEKSKGRIVTVGSMDYNMGIKTIKFDDLNWDNHYTPNNAYSHSKLAQKAFYGPIGRNNWVGPVGAHPIESHAKDKAAAKRLWGPSEK